MVTIYAVATRPFKHSFQTEPPCQLSSIDRYCRAHDYSCFHFSASLDEWQRERKYEDIDGGFFKLQAVRTLLPHHAWVLYLDTDNYVSEAAPGVEAAVGRLPWIPRPQKASESAAPGPSEASLLIHGHPGETWISSAFLVRNTAWAAAYLDHAWALREHCPDCQREQCAMNIAIFESILMPEVMVRHHHQEDHQLSADSDVPQSSSAVERTLNISAISQAPAPPLSCCNPRAYCRFPEGRAKQTKPHQSQLRSRLAQSCAAIWLTSAQAAQSLPPEVHALPTERQANVFWSETFLNMLQIRHGVKNTFRRDQQDNMSSAIKGRPRNCAPFTPPEVNHTKAERCLEIALSPEGHREEWQELACHTYGRANAARFVKELNSSSEYLSDLATVVRMRAQGRETIGRVGSNSEQMQRR